MALKELAAKLLLERRKLALDGGLAPAQRFGCRNCAARSRDREEITQVTPVEHAPTLCILGE
jgi:hypothetical protein